MLSPDMETASAQVIALETEKTYFPNLLSQFVYTRTYSRWLPEKGRRETWPETVQRYVDFISSERNIPPRILEEIHSAILNMEVMPSMRALWAAGDPARRDNTCLYNCSFVPMDSLKAFSEITYILMQGTGAGFSVEQQFIENLPIVESLKPQVMYHVVSDSAEGWADALYYGLKMWYGGYAVKFDYSKVRPAGAVLKTKGGRASGPEPLVRLMKFAQETILSASGRKLTSLECHDIVCCIGDIVVSGGVRRSALISISDVEDLEMRHAKDWSLGDFPQIRHMSNNSAFYEDRPDSETFWKEWDALVKSGSGERGFLVDSAHKRAPRPRGMTRTNPCVTGDTRVMTQDGLVQIRDLVPQTIGGVNVCIDRRFNEVNLLQASTLKGAFKTGTKEIFRLSTVEGYSLRLTADHRVMTVDGWKPAGELKAGDVIHIANTEGQFGNKGSYDAGLLAGWLTGDGTINQNGVPRWYFYGQDREISGMFHDAAERLTGIRPSPSYYEPSNREHFESRGLIEFLGEVVQNKFRVPEIVWQGTKETQKGYIQGLFSADGSFQGTREKGVSVRLASSKLDLLHEVQQLLLNFGIASRVYAERRPAGLRELPDGKGGTKEYMCEADHELVLSKQNVVSFYKEIGFVRPDKQNALADEVESRLALAGTMGDKGRKIRGFYKENFTAHVESVKSDGVEDVFDMTVPNTHSFIAGGIVVHNCGEIMLRFTHATEPISGTNGSGSFCNLSAAIMRPWDTLETMANKIRIATWLGAIQSTFTYFPYLRPGWEQICKEDRLLGVDITGQADNPELATNPDAMRLFNRIAIGTAEIAARHFNMNMPAAITCGKPSGNSSQFLDCGSGFHNRYAPFYFRHVRINADDPLFHLIRDSGIPVFKENGQEHLPDDEVVSWVARFPVKAPESSMLREHETAIEQLNRYLQIMRTWMGERGHNQSATIYVRDNEWQDVGEWVWNHFDEVGGLSFLPFDGGAYRLAPYEEITEEEYEQAVALMPEVDFSYLQYYEQYDMGNGSVELACKGGSCEL